MIPRGLSKCLRLALAASLWSGSMQVSASTLTAPQLNPHLRTRLNAEALSVSARFAGRRMLSRAPRAMQETIPEAGRGARIITLNGLTNIQEVQLSASIPAATISHDQRVALASIFEERLNNPATFRELPFEEIPIAKRLALQAIDLLRQVDPKIYIGPSRFSVKILWTPKNIPFTFDNVTVHAFAAQKPPIRKRADGVLRIHAHDAAGLLHEIGERALAPQQGDIDPSQYHHYGLVLELLAGSVRVQLDSQHATRVSQRIVEQIGSMSRTSRILIQNNQSAAIDQDWERFPFGSPSNEGMRKHFLRFAQALSVLAEQAPPPATSVRVVEVVSFSETEAWLSHATGHVKLNDQENPEKTEPISIVQAHRLLNDNQVRLALWSDGIEGLIWHGAKRSTIIAGINESSTVQDPAGDVSIHVGSLEFTVKHTPTGNDFLMPNPGAQNIAVRRKTYWPLVMGKTYTVGPDHSDFNVAEMRKENTRFSFITYQDGSTDWSVKVTNLSPEQPVELKWSKLPRVSRWVPRRLTAWAPMSLSISTYSAFQASWDSLDILISPWLVKVAIVTALGVALNQYLKRRRERSKVVPFHSTVQKPVTPVIITRGDSTIVIHDASEPESKDFLEQWRPRSYGPAIHQVMEFNLNLLLNHVGMPRDHVFVETRLRSLPPLEEIQRALNGLPSDGAYIFLDMRSGPLQFERQLNRLNFPNLKVDIYSPNVFEPGALVIRRNLIQTRRSSPLHLVALAAMVLAGSAAVWMVWDIGSSLNPSIFSMLPYTLPLFAMASMNRPVAKKRFIRQEDPLLQYDKSIEALRLAELIGDPVLKAEEFSRVAVQRCSLISKLSVNKNRDQEILTVLEHAAAISQSVGVDVKLRFAVNDSRARMYGLLSRDDEAETLFLQELDVIDGLLRRPPQKPMYPGWEFRFEQWQVLNFGTGDDFMDLVMYLKRVRTDVIHALDQLKRVQENEKRPPSPSPAKATLSPVKPIDPVEGHLQQFVRSIQEIRMTSSPLDSAFELEVWIDAFSTFLGQLRPGLVPSNPVSSEKLSGWLAILYTGTSRKKFAAYWDKRPAIKTAILDALLGIADTLLRLKRYPETEQTLKVANTFTPRDNPQLLAIQAQLQSERNAYEAEQAQQLAESVARAAEEARLRAEQEAHAAAIRKIREELAYWFPFTVILPLGTEGDYLVQFLFEFIGGTLTREQARARYANVESLHDILSGDVLRSIFRDVDDESLYWIAHAFIGETRPYSLLGRIALAMGELIDVPLTPQTGRTIREFFAAVQKVPHDQLPAAIARIIRSAQSPRQNHQLGVQYVKHLLSMETRLVDSLSGTLYRNDVKLAFLTLREHVARDGSLVTGWLDAEGIHTDKVVIRAVAVVMWAALPDRLSHDFHESVSELEILFEEDVEVHELVTWFLKNGNVQYEFRVGPNFNLPAITRKALLKVAKEFGFMNGELTEDQVYDLMVHYVAQWVDDDGRESIYRGALLDLDVDERLLAEKLFKAVPAKHPVRRAFKKGPAVEKIKFLRSLIVQTPEIIGRPRAVRQHALLRTAA